MKSNTIYDVAREAGLSIKTVSRVLNHDPAVKAANREKVMRAVEALAYHPNLSARSLAGAKSFVIAAFVDAGLTLDHWRNGRAADYLARLQLGATLECRKAGYHFTLELIDHDRADVMREARDVLSALRPDGVLLTPPSCDDPELLGLLDAAKVRYARLGPDPALPGGLQLGLGDREGAAKMTRHLLDLGHRRIGVIGGEPLWAASRTRMQGVREALAAAGLEIDPALVRSGDFTFQSGLEGAQALLDAALRPTAIFALSDEMALGCLAALDERDLVCPRDVSVAGFDDSAGARFSRPQLTTVRPPLIEMAAQGVRSIIDAKSYAPGVAEQVHGPELIVRTSTAAVA